MNLTKFLEGYPDVIFGSKDDEIFSFYRILFHGMCSHRLAKLLNFAAKCMNENDIYLEIGTYAGYSILSAGYECGGQFVGIDNFSETYHVSGSVRDVLKDNLYHYPGSYVIVDNDFRNVKLETVLKPDAKISVFLIDGKHTYEDVVDSLKFALPFFSNQVVVIFDDLNVVGVKRAVEEIRHQPGFEEIFFANSFYDNSMDRGMSSDKYIHNGFSVMTYKKEVTNV